MAAACGRTYRIDPRIDPAACNSLTQGADGLLVPTVEIEPGPGVTVTPPTGGACPALWQVGIDSAWVQNGNMLFAHTLAGADRTWEHVTAVPTLTIPRAGVWEVDYNTRGAVGLPTGTAGALYVTAGLYKNGALIVGSETLLVGTAGTGSGGQATGGIAFFHSFLAGDTVELWAYRIGQAGTASVISNPDGRTRIAAHWLGPEGDTPA